MAATYIHTCYRIFDPERSEDFYMGKLGMKKGGEMDSARPPTSSSSWASPAP